MLLTTLDSPPLARPPDDSLERQQRARVLHLFRHALRLGSINPLLHIVLRLRLERE